MRRGSRATKRPKERALICGVALSDSTQSCEDEAEEARGLVAAADAEPVGEMIVQRRQRADPATLFGKGKVDEIKASIAKLHPDLVVVDNDLSPAQARNLETAWNTRVVDRSELILDIFAKRAQTRQARLQVELAQNEYLAPRLRRMWTHLERMEGAIGTRGPGETQLETDKRLIKRRIQDLRTELKEIEARKLREVESRSGAFSVGLVGYTNAGKSTLLNRLTGADEFVADMLFATLDTRTRRWRLSDGRTVLLSDTVGFLRRLPHHLVASFHATLEETLNADLLIHVVDASHPEVVAQMAAVDQVLDSVSRTTRAGVLALNKVDRVADPIELQALESRRVQHLVRISALTGEGLEQLDAIVRSMLDERSRVMDLYFDSTRGDLREWIHRMSAPLEEESVSPVLDRIRARLSEEDLARLRRAGGSAIRAEVVESVPSGPLSEAADPPSRDKEIA